MSWNQLKMRAGTPRCEHCHATSQLTDIDIKEARKLLSSMHISLSHPALRVGTWIGDLDHVELVDGHTLDQSRVCAEQPLEQLRAQRGGVAVSSEFFFAIEEKIDRDPERTCVLGADMTADFANLRHFGAPLSSGPDRSTRYERVRNRPGCERHGSARTRRPVREGFQQV